MFDKLKIALVLVVIGAVSGLTIFSVNALTEERIAQNLIEREQGYYKELFFLDDDTVITYEETDIDGDIDKEIIIYDNLGDEIGYIYKGTDQNNYGEVIVLVGITLDGDVSKVVISSTKNTPTFVKVIKTVYLANFNNQNVNDIQIDDSTGATYTYTSVVEIVNESADYYIENRGGLDD